jgi:tetratricopeptide (TPR) repeat protein
VSGHLLATIGLHQEGRLTEAIAGYRDVLRLEPLQSDALRLLGAALYQSGQLEAAADVLRQAAAVDPSSAEVWGNLGTVLSEMKRHSEAEPAFERLVALRPDSADARNFHGVELLSLQRLVEAQAEFERATTLDPGLMHAWLNRGIAARELGHAAEALRWLSRALHLAPGSVAVQVEIARTLCAERRYWDAETMCRSVLSTQPENIDALRMHARTLLARRDAEQALVAFDRALSLGDRHPETPLFRAMALRDLGRAEEALDDLDAYLQRRPDAWLAHVQKAATLRRLGRNDEARACLEEARDRGQTSVECWRALAGEHAQAGEHDAAVAAITRALAMEPSDAGIRYERAVMLLRIGDFAAGWAEYASRFDAPFNALQRPRHARDWSGEEPLEGKSILVYAEQGAGDTVQFCRYAPELARRGAEVRLVVPPPLAGLLQQLPAIHVFADGDPVPSSDYQCALLDLPGIFGTRMQTIPWSGPYLKPDPASAAAWQALFTPTGGTRIGIACSGSPRHSNDRDRSMPLAKFSALAQPGIRLHLVQNDLRPQDLPALRALDVADHRLELRDFRETSALLSSLDLVITVDTSIAHLAGALGLPVWVLLPALADWRWLVDRPDSPWYPTARLFRQPVAGDWDGAIARIAQALDDLP